VDAVTAGERGCYSLVSPGEIEPEIEPEIEALTGQEISVFTWRSPIFRTWPHQRWL